MTTIKKEYSAESDAIKKDFSADLSVKLANDANPSVSGEYTDTLTFTMDCQKKTYTVVYDGNGADGGETMQSDTFDCGESATLAKNLYEKKGYHFAGWSTEKVPATFDKLYGDNKKVEALSNTDGETVTLYAQWGHEYKVVVHYEGVEDNFADAEIKTDFDKVLKEGSTFTWNCATADENPKKWKTVTPLSETVGTADKTFDVNALRQCYYIDLNGRLLDKDNKVMTEFNGQTIGGGNIRGFGKADVYINGKLVASNVDDYFQLHRYGTTFYVKESDTERVDGCQLLRYEYIPSAKTDAHGQEYGTALGSRYVDNATGTIGAYYVDSVLMVYQYTGESTSSVESTDEQSLTITDTMRDYFADLYPEDETTDTDAAAEDAEDTTAEPPETALDDGYDSYDDYIVDEYPVVFFETE